VFQSDGWYGSLYFFVHCCGSIDRLRQLLVEFLQSCYLEIIYDTADYMMAREIQVSYTKLVTVEVLIDKTTH